MNQALDIYKDESCVGMIHAQIYDIPDLPELFFMYKSGCLGWATWQRAWRQVSFDGCELLRQIEERKLQQIFDIDGAFPYVQMLRDQIAGKNSSWAIRLYASFLLQGLLTFYPGKSLAVHIGYEGGTHTDGGVRTAMDGVLAQREIQAKRIPVDNSVNAVQKLAAFYVGFALAEKRKQYVKKILKKIGLFFIVRTCYVLVRDTLQKFQR